MPHVLLSHHSRDLSAWAMMAALIAGIEICVIVAAAHHGFDVTDEGFYLNSIARDSEGSSHVSSFGQIFRPMAIVLDGDVRALR